MNLPKYPLASSDKLTTFEFISEGPKGLIYKLVQFHPTNLKDVYNLSFGDKDHTTGNIDDTVISNNRMGITKFLSEVTEDFDVLGERNNAWEIFGKDIEYEGFLVKRKSK